MQHALTLRDLEFSAIGAKIGGMRFVFDEVPWRVASAAAAPDEDW